MTELGQTHDPKMLIPGDPTAVLANCRMLRTRAQHAERAGDDLARVDAGAWEGAASEAFREKFSYEPNRWYEAANALFTTADVLATYAETLQWAQTRAGEAIRMWDEGQAESRLARQAYDQVVAQAALGQAAAVFVDPGSERRQAAVEALQLARDQVSRAGDAAARSTTQEADAAPKDSSWLDRIGDLAQDTGAAVVNGLASFGNAMVNHPGETATLIGGIALTAVSAGGEGLGFALDATGIGAVAGVPLNAVSAVGLVAGAGLTGAAATSLMQHAAGEDAVSPASGSTPPRSIPNKTNRLKEHLTERDLDAARRELDGEVVATKSTGQPWDHVDEVHNAQRGLVRRIDQLKRLLGDSRVAEGDRAGYQSELSEASRLLDHSEQFVPRL